MKIQRGAKAIHITTGKLVTVGIPSAIAGELLCELPQFERFVDGFYKFYSVPERELVAVAPPAQHD